MKTMALTPVWIVLKMSDLAVIGGLLAAGFYHKEPTIVSIATVLGIAGWLAGKGMAAIINSANFRREVAEGVETARLRLIRHHLRHGMPITDEMLTESESASAKADQEYRNLFGFYRPGFAVRANAGAKENPQ